MRTARSSSRPGGGLHQAPPWSRHPTRTRHPPLWTEFLTHAYENITLPQTSFAGDKKSAFLSVILNRSTLILLVIIFKFILQSFTTTG